MTKGTQYFILVLVIAALLIATLIGIGALAGGLS